MYVLTSLAVPREHLLHCGDIHGSGRILQQGVRQSSWDLLRSQWRNLQWKVRQLIVCMATYCVYVCYECDGTFCKSV